MSARSQLVRREVSAAEGARPRGTLLALHSDGADAAELLPLCASQGSGFAVLAPQASRSRNPFLGSAPPDDPRWRDYAGFSWFRRDDAGRPEPASFGDSLWQVQQLLLELRERGDDPVYVVGFREGATLALGAARALPGLADGVFALGGEAPEIPGWPAEAAADGRPHVAHVRAGYTDPRGAAEALAAFLDTRLETQEGSPDDGRG